MSVNDATVSAMLFEALKTSAMSRVMACDPVVLDVEAQWAVWEVLRDLPVYRKAETIPAVAGQSAYTLSLPPTEHAVTVLAAWYGTRRLHGARVAPIERPTGTPGTVHLTSYNTIELWPAPPADTTLEDIRVEFSATVLPLASVTTTYALLTPESAPVPIPPAGPPVVADPYTAAPYVMPQVLASYLDVVLELLLARVFSMPDKPWTNNLLAAQHRRAYRAHRTEGLWTDQRSNVAGALQARPRHRFA